MYGNTGQDNQDGLYSSHDGKNVRTKRTKLAMRLAALALVVALIAAGFVAWNQLFRHADALMGAAGTTDAPSGIAQTYAGPPIAKLSSPVDYDHDGIDDYTDIMQGAKMDAKVHPAYDAGYYRGGYPPADRGACTDVVWRAFKNAGYDLKAMVDADIAADPKSYAGVAAKPDSNIDFRRVSVLNVFFGKYARHLTTDIADHADWQQGDLVIFNTRKHIGVISDMRDRQAIPYVLHNMGQSNRENDYLAFHRRMAVTAHYRFDASHIPQSVLRPWHS